MNRPSVLALGVLALAGRTAAAQPAQDPRVDEVVEAAFRQQIAFWLDYDPRDTRTVLCLAIEQGGVSKSVAKAYLRRFRSQERLRSAAECEARQSGARERATGGPAVLLSAGDVEWIAPDEAWVRVRHFRSRHSAGLQQYRVVRQQERWICLGPILKLSPA